LPPGTEMVSVYMGFTVDFLGSPAQQGL